MTREAWIMMSISVSTVLALVGFCLYRVLSLPPLEQDHVKGPLEIDTGDTQAAD
jgi:hypothetical protein